VIVPHYSCLKDHLSWTGLFMYRSFFQVLRIQHYMYFCSLLYEKTRPPLFVILAFIALICYSLVKIRNFNLITRIFQSLVIPFCEVHILFFNALCSISDDELWLYVLVYVVVYDIVCFSSKYYIAYYGNFKTAWRGIERMYLTTNNTGALEQAMKTLRGSRRIVLLFL
jgi:hypothetical protein